MNFDKLDGLIPAVIQDDRSGEVLMVGFMNPEALERTRATGFATFFSRSRNRLWMKGETSGNRLRVTSMLLDCDDDTVLLKVTRLGDGNVCHTGERSCFRMANAKWQMPNEWQMANSNDESEVVTLDGAAGPAAREGDER